MEPEESPPIPAPRANRRSNPPPITPEEPPEEPSEDSSDEELDNVDEFYSLYEGAYEATSNAQDEDRLFHIDLALKGYDKALEKIDEVVAFAHKGGFPADKVDKIDEKTMKIRRTRKDILERITDLQNYTFAQEDFMQGPSHGAERSPDMPPAYTEVAGPGEAVGGPVTYNDLATVLDEISNEQTAASNPLPINAREIFGFPDNVQIYYISADDNVSAPTYPSFLRLVVMDETEGELDMITSSVPAFLQVGDWTYPLIPGHSPVFRSSEGIYMFPDLTTNVPGSYVGLILPFGTDLFERLKFEGKLLKMVGANRFPEPTRPGYLPQKKAPEIPPRPVLPKSAMVEPPVPTERRLSTKIAEGLISGAEAVSRGLLYGATKTSKALDKGAAFLQSRIDPAKEKANIKPEYRKGMKTAKTVTGKAVQVSGFIVSQVGQATMALGRHLAPHVHKASTKILANTVADDEVDASRKVDQVLEVTAGAVSGIGTVYMGLEKAAKVLASSIADNTVQIVQHRYGEESGEFAKDTAATAGNAALTAWNTKHLAPKSLAKRAVKNTGKMVLKKHEEKQSSDGPSTSANTKSPYKIIEEFKKVIQEDPPGTEKIVAVKESVVVVQAPKKKTWDINWETNWDYTPTCNIIRPIDLPEVLKKDAKESSSSSPSPDSEGNLPPRASPGSVNMRTPDAPLDSERNLPPRASPGSVKKKFPDAPLDWERNLPPRASPGSVKKKFPDAPLDSERNLLPRTSPGSVKKKFPDAPLDSERNLPPRTSPGSVKKNFPDAPLNSERNLAPKTSPGSVKKKFPDAPIDSERNLHPTASPGSVKKNFPDAPLNSERNLAPKTSPGSVKKNFPDAPLNSERNLAPKTSPGSVKKKFPDAPLDWERNLAPRTSPGSVKKKFPDAPLDWERNLPPRGSPGSVKKNFPDAPLDWERNFPPRASPGSVKKNFPDAPLDWERNFPPRESPGSVKKKFPDAPLDSERNLPPRESPGSAKKNFPDALLDWERNIRSRASPGSVKKNFPDTPLDSERNLPPRGSPGSVKKKIPDTPPNTERNLPPRGSPVVAKKKIPDTPPNTERNLPPRGSPGVAKKKF